ncbi:guanylate-binding protein 1-like [Mustelus asterias]
MAPYTEIESPMLLIKNSAEGSLSVCQDAVDALKRIGQPLVVVAIVGKYRTGKSFLLNRLAGKQEGFALGGSVQSKTKGIWIWCRPHPRMTDHCLVLLDTEGLGDVEKGDESNDNKLFALAILLSSMLVYNSKGTIDQQALQDIDYVTQLTSIIQTKSGTENDEGKDFMEYFPGFVWVVRDFTLELKIDKQSITADQYLENALQLKPGSDEKSKKFNLPKQCIRYYFRSRNCFVLDCPGNRHVLQNVETVNESKLEPGFVQACNKFCDFIYTKAKGKTVPNCGNKVVTGGIFAHLVNTYVDTIGSGKLAILDKVVATLAEAENEKAVNEAKKHYEVNMNQEVVLPTETAAELNNIHEKCHKEAFDIFLKRALGSTEKHKDKLEAVVKKIFEDYSKRNEKKSEEKCKDLLKELFEEIDTKITSNSYAKAGGYVEYLTDRKDAVKSYNSNPQKGVKAKEILKEFLDQKMSESECIRQMDQGLTEQQKRIEAEKEKQAQLELQKAANDHQLQMMKEMMESVARSNEQMMNKFMKILEDEREAAKRQTMELDELKLRERAKMEKESNSPPCTIQ